MSAHTHLLELCCLLGALFLAGNVWFYVRVFRPIKQLSGQAERLKTGDLDSFEQSFHAIAEVHDLQRALAGMCGHVRRAQREQTAYHHALTDGQEAERARIAHELHDDTVQSLIAIARSVELAAGWLTSKPDQAAGILQSAREQAVQSVDNLRRLIGNLRPPMLAELGLIPALKMLARDVTGTVDIRVTGVERRLDEAHELALFRSVQEGVHNALNHSGVDRVAVTVAYVPDQVQIIIADQGRGFVIPDSPAEWVTHRHYGLIGLIERIESLKGQVKIDSAPGKGTALTVSLPLKPASQPGATVRDPVCHAEIHPQQAYDSVVHAGVAYYFCCPVCQGAFQRDPAAYVG